MNKILFFLPALKLIRISVGLFISLFVMVVCISAQTPPIQWQKCLGGSANDWVYVYSFQLTPDGGYIVAGYTESNNGDVSGNHGIDDIWVVKLTAIGAIQWQKCLGGSGQDFLSSIKLTPDGGYIVLGETYSNDGDVSGKHGIFNPDIWVVKLTNAGAIQWQKCLGGSDWEYSSSIQLTPDGGYIVAGSTPSNDGDVSGNHGDYDIWVVKLTATGVIQWQKCLGGSGLDGAYYDGFDVLLYPTHIQPTPDGDYIVSGLTSSNNGDVSGNHGDADIWVVKLTATGTIQWQKCLGGSSLETNGHYDPIKLTPDGGYIVLGLTNSNDGDVSGNHGLIDAWVVKLTSTGTSQWQKCLGGSGDDVALNIQLTPDAGYILVGGTDSNDGDVSGNHGNYDSWVVKLTSTGTIQWQKCLGGSSDDYGNFIQQTHDGGYIVSGGSASNDGDVSGNHGDYDTWVVKLNSTGTIQWQKCLGGSSYEYVYFIQQTPDGGYIVAGITWSNDGNVSGNHGGGDIWVVKLGSGPLPIKLIDITARNQGSVNIINWSSASEDPGESYKLERSADAIHFEKITSIAGKGRAADYEYADASPLTGINYYRLRLIHNTGTPDYSKIVSAFVKTGIELRVYPNPANVVLYVQLNRRGNGNAILFITDAAGKIVMKNNISNTNQTVIDISKLPAGFYTLRYQHGERNIIKTFIVN